MTVIFFYGFHYTPLLPIIPIYALFKGKTTKGGGGQKTADPALCVRPQKHRLPFQCQAARRHDQETHQDHQGGTRETEGKS